MYEIAHDQENLVLTQADKIAKARTLLLEKIFTESGNESLVAKEAVRKLLGALQAARDSGLPFESLAEVFNVAGIKITANTLRAYYFDLRSEVAVNKRAKKLAENLTRTKAAVDLKIEEAAQKEQVDKLLKKFGPASQAASKKASAKADKSVAIHGNAMQITGPASQADKNESAIADQKKQPNLPLANSDPTPSLSLESAVKSRDEKLLGRESPVSPVVPIAVHGLSLLTLDQIEEMSLKTEDRTKLTEDLVIRDGLVMTVSGKAFVGALSKKQIHLLRTAGKLVAPTTGNSSKDFVAMKNNL